MTITFKMYIILCYYQVKHNQYLGTRMKNFSNHKIDNKQKYPQISNKYQYSSHQQFQDLQYEIKIFSSEDVQEYFNLLKRLHLSIPNTPQIKKKRQYNSKIQVQFKIYNKIWASHLYEQNFECKIKSIILIIKAYLQLVKQYGLFSITVNHIKMNIYKEQVIWINHNFHQNYCSHPLQSSKHNQQKIAYNFISLIQDSFQTNIFKYKNVHNLADLLDHLEFINKRNIIHKKCNFLAKEKKRRSTVNLGSPQHKTKQNNKNFFYLSQGDFSHIMASNIIKQENENQQKHLTKSTNTECFKSRHLKNKPSQAATTHFSTQQKINKNKSYLQLSNVFNKITKQSTNTFSPVTPNNNQQIKRSQYIVRQNDFSKVLDNNMQQQNNRLFSGLQRQNYNTNDQQNILQRDLNNLLLSEIHEDEQNDMKPHPNYQTQLIQEFYNILN